MKDKLKIYVEKNRESFETYKIDSSEVWMGIDSKLKELEPVKPKFPWVSILKVAAILFVVISIGFGFYLNNQRISINKNGIALHNISSELADIEAFYASQISDKIKLIDMSVGGMDTQLKKQLALLDEDYQALKEDLRDNADSEEVINAMIEYYRLKLSMLEKILNEIQKNDTKDHEETLAV